MHEKSKAKTSDEIYKELEEKYSDLEDKYFDLAKQTGELGKSAHYHKCHCNCTYDDYV